MLTLLEPILAHVPSFALVLFRVTGIFLAAPLYASQAIPARVKVMLALTLALCLYPAMLAAAWEPALLARIEAGEIAGLHAHGKPLSLWLMPALVALEMAIGLAIGFGANLPLLGMEGAGRIIDQQLGISLGGVFNPDLDEESTATGQTLFILALASFVIMGGHRVLLRILLGSFDHVPPGGLGDPAPLLELALALLRSMLELSLRVAGPLLGLVLLETIALGFISKIVPQFHLMNLGFPARILMGFALLATVVGLASEAFGAALRAALGELAEQMGGLRG